SPETGPPPRRSGRMASRLHGGRSFLQYASGTGRPANEDATWTLIVPTGTLTTRAGSGGAGPRSPRTDPTISPAVTAPSLLGAFCLSPLQRLPIRRTNNRTSKRRGPRALRRACFLVPGSDREGGT